MLRKLVSIKAQGQNSPGAVWKVSHYLKVPNGPENIRKQKSIKIQLFKDVLMT